MKVITVRQPWAWAIMHGGKDVENRSRNIVGSHRGRVAIHAGQADADNAPDRLWMDAMSDLANTVLREPGISHARTHRRGYILGTVEVVSVHHCSDHGRNETDTCSPWALADHWHIRLANPEPFDEPIPAKGQLGLWTYEPTTKETA